MSDEITDENLSLRINMMISFFNDRRTRLYDKKPLKFKVVKQFNGSYLLSRYVSSNGGISTVFWAKNREQLWEKVNGIIDILMIMNAPNSDTTDYLINKDLVMEIG
jgi:hypothetical protein